MKYSVGEVARLLDMTPSALRFYEAEKIIFPEKSESGHRYYDLGDLVRLISSKKYGSMGISIKTIAGQFKENGDSREVIAGRLRKKADEARERAEYYQILSQIIEDHAQNMQEISSNLAKFSFYLREEYYILSDPEQQLFSKKRDMLKLMQTWIKGVPATKISIVNQPNKEGSAGDSVLGYSISARHAQALKIPVDHASVIHLPPCLCIRTMEAIEDAFNIPEQVFSPVFDYVKPKGLRQKGSSLAVLSVVESARDNHYMAYLDVTAPVQLED